MELGSINELPADYRAEMAAAGVTPLWPILRDSLPRGLPRATCAPTHWRYEKLRPLLLRAGELTPIERAERRVLVLSGTGYGEAAAQATPSIYLGMQLLLPGERAPSHRHTPSAVRLAVEGAGASTLVEGERLPMEPGDLVLTPHGEWHEHAHEGQEPVIWLDALDLPLLIYLEASYAEEAGTEAQPRIPDRSAVEYVASGLRPKRPTGVAAPKNPLRRFPWKRTREALRALIQSGSKPYAEMEFINPETGESVLPTLGFCALLIRAERQCMPARCSPAAAFHVVEGRGCSEINGEKIRWQEKDTFCAPAFASIVHEAEEDSYLIRIDESPLHQKLGIYEERANV